MALQEVDSKKQVKIPRQIRLKTEFFVGFGMEELIKTLIENIFYKCFFLYFLN